MSNSTGKFLIMYDFAESPRSAFYSVLDELVRGGALHYVQKSIYIAKSPDDAADLVALLEWYRAKDIRSVPIGEGTLDAMADRKAAERRIADLHAARLHRRGRKPTKVKRTASRK